MINKIIFALKTSWRILVYDFIIVVARFFKRERKYEEVQWWNIKLDQVSFGVEINTYFLWKLAMVLWLVFRYNENISNFKFSTFSLINFFISLFCFILFHLSWAINNKYISPSSPMLFLATFFCILLVKYDKHFFQFVVGCFLSFQERLSQQYHLINFSWTSWYREMTEKFFSSLPLHTRGKF